jgi:hypothetical protein
MLDPLSPKIISTGTSNAPAISRSSVASPPNATSGIVPISGRHSPPRRSLAGVEGIRSLNGGAPPRHRALA